MASFCSNCGTAQVGSSRFCVQCGAPQAAVAPPPAPAYQAPQAPPATQAYAPAPPIPQGFQAPLPPAKKGSGLKILAVVVIFFVVAGAATLGGLYYAAHRLKQAVVDKAASVGVDLNSISSPTASGATSRSRNYKACALLSQADAAAMLGEPIERIEDQGATCIYWAPAGLSGKLAQEGAQELSKRVQQPGAKIDPNDVTDSLSKIMGGLAAQAGAAQSGSSNGDVPLLTFVVDGTDGKPQMTALTASRAIFSGIGKGADGGNHGFGEVISGLGDRAVRLPPLGLNVLEGDALIRLIPGPVPDANNKTIAIARAILPKL